VQKETDGRHHRLGRQGRGHQFGADTLTNFLGQNMGQEITDPSMVVMFIAPMNTPGIKLICRPSYEFAARPPPARRGIIPLTSRFDENRRDLRVRQ